MSRIRGLVRAPLLALAVLLTAGSAQAYPWMIRHGYTNCSGCHVDPSGWGLLNEYGRAQAQILLPTLWGRSPDEVQPTTGILYGAVPLPSWLNVGVSLRGAVLSTTTSGKTDWRDILMIADLRAGITAGPFLASISVGYLPVGGLLAAVTHQPRDNLVMREHWLGVRVDDQKLYFILGRTNLPFGLRNVEHNSFVRSATRTDTNSAQQYGGQVVWDGPGVRAALMGIAGNFLIQNAAYREHGYSGYVEGAFSNSFTLGLSSLLTNADKGTGSFANPYVFADPFLNASNVWRQAHGLFSRWHVGGPWVVMAEADLLVQSATGVSTDWGGTGFLQADVEPLQGLHFIVTGEGLRQNQVNSASAWFSVAWFFFTYCEARVDTVFTEFGLPGGGHQSSFSVLGQLHFSM
ncbi:MAG TPA: hypothetical protein VLQ79_03585 [Myxococcaceae bacterium]|nr:hypothetical protein [Myxococcaceae bacterium]